MRTYDALTTRGRIVRLRAARGDDADALRDLHSRASSHSRYLRFFSAGAATEPEVRRLLREADGVHVALVAEEDGRLVGVGSYERTGPAEAEFAVLVDDTRQGEGIGTLILESLSAQARQDGIDDLVGDVLAENHAMMHVAGDLNPHVHTARGDGTGTMRVRIPTSQDDQSIAAIGSRDRTAEHCSLRPLLAPTSVAVIGAGRRPGGIGRAVLTALVDGRYAGAVYPVNPAATQVAGLRAYPSASAIGAPVDLAVVAVPAAAAVPAVTDCAHAHVRAAVLLTAGIGAADLATLLRVARTHGMRLVGPNCLGVLNTDPAVRMVAAFTPTTPLEGGLAVASQSGAVGVAILDAASRAGVGVSAFVSLGDKIDVSGNDLLEYWYDDPTTRAVALYLESFGNPRRFAWVARALARRKPVLAVKSGRSADGRRAGAAHTAAPAAPDVAVDSLFAQAGVIRTDTLGELLDVARVLVDQPLPGGHRVAVMGNTGGLNVLAADAAETAGLSVPDLAGSGNPIDLGAEATAEAVAAAVTALAHQASVDALVVTFVATRTNDVPGTLRALADAVDAAADLPIVVVLVGVDDPPTALGERRVPVFALPEPAMRALGRAAGYAAWRRRPLGERPDLPGVDGRGARALVDKVLADGRSGWQPPDLTRAILGSYGVSMRDAGNADDKDAAAQAAAPVGVDIVAGIRHDRQFGSLVTLGSAGACGALFGDRVHRLLPITTADAAEMWRELRAAPLLTGYGGEPPGDTDALEDLLLRLGRLAEDLPQVAQLDLDPVVVTGSTVTVASARLRLAEVQDELDPYLRALQPPPARPVAQPDSTATPTA